MEAERGCQRGSHRCIIAVYRYILIERLGFWTFQTTTFKSISWVKCVFCATVQS